LNSGCSWEQGRIELPESVECELNRYCRQEQAHDAHGDTHCNRADPAGAARRKAEDEIAGHANGSDAQIQGDALAMPAAWLWSMMAVDMAPGPDNMGIAKRRYGDVRLFGARRRLLGGLLNAGALRS